MNVTRTYEGWTIRFGFLDGNLGDNECITHAPDYAEAVQEALEASYPGAQVEVPWQRDAGSVPFPLRTAAFDPEGEEQWSELRNITQIAEDVYQSFTRPR